MDRPTPMPTGAVFAAARRVGQTAFAPSRLSNCPCLDSPPIPFTFWVRDRRLNVIDLEFDDNKLRFGPVPEDEPLRTLVRRVERGTVASLPVPGPKGITGELWNLYIDRDLRIAAGMQDDNQVEDLSILRRATWAGPLPPYSDRTPESCD